MVDLHDVFQWMLMMKKTHPLSLHKLQKNDEVWDTTKQILGFTFDRVPNQKILWLTEDKLHLGIPFQEFELVIQKVCHIFITISNGNGHLLPFDRVIKNNTPLSTCIKTGL
jgi:hypothetical protein